MYTLSKETVTELGKVTLRYELISSLSETDIPYSTYGIEVTLEGNGFRDSRRIDGISAEKAEVMALMDSMSDGEVTPVTAADVVDDYLNW